MKKINFAISFILFYASVFAQNTASIGYIPPKRESVPQTRYDTYTKILRDNYGKEKTYERFEGMFTTRIPYHNYYWSTALSYNNLGEPADSVFYYFEKALTLDSMRTCSIFEFYHERLVPEKKLMDWKILDSVRYNKFKPVCDKCLLEFRSKLAKEREETEKDSTLNHPLIAEIKQMFFDDQVYRKQMNGVENKENLAILWALQTQNDLKNETKLAAIFDKYGYPTKKMVSKHHCLTAAIILLHTPSSFQRQYLPIMITAFKNKDVSVIDITMLLDKIWCGEEKKQLFGTQSSSTDKGIPKLDKKLSIKILNDLNLGELINEL